MKKRYLFFCVLLLCVQRSPAQITISTADVNSVTAPGSGGTSYSDSTTTVLNIGTTGSSSCNFSSLIQATSYHFSYVTPGSTPFAAEYPGSTSTMFYLTTDPDSIVMTAYAYVRIDTSYKNLGMVMYAEMAPAETMVTRTVYNPWSEGFLLPLTYGRSWTRSYTTTSSVQFPGLSLPPTTAQVTVQVTVDAYGSVTFPGGTVDNCVRMRLDKRTLTTSMFGPPTYKRIIEYCWSSRTGNVLTATAADTTSPDHGTIPVSGICWSLRGLTAVEAAAERPLTYALRQNYPNPFNPSTTLSYSMPAPSYVSLKVFDVLGREVETLYEGRQEAGVHEATWNAKNVASGVFFARLSVADEHGNLRYGGISKMVLMK